MRRIHLTKKKKYYSRILRVYLDPVLNFIITYLTLSCVYTRVVINVFILKSISFNNNHHNNSVVATTTLLLFIMLLALHRVDIH